MGKQYRDKYFTEYSESDLENAFYAGESGLYADFEEWVKEEIEAQEKEEEPNHA